MILILAPDTDKDGTEYRQLLEFLSNLENIQSRVHDEKGTQQTLMDYTSTFTAQIQG